MTTMRAVGKIHSIESFGTLDGPGIRLVIFLQGCPMRCLYCHNPDTWEIGCGKEISAEEIIREFNKNRDFYTNGGITVTGGEPLLQLDFVTELFKMARAEGIHTAIDTSGITYNENEDYLARLDELTEHTSLVMLDVKHIDSSKHKALTGHGNEKILSFAKYLEKKGVPLRVRHVVAEGYTDGEDDLYKLGLFLGSLKNLKALEVLPYHTLGVSKYKELGIPYPFEGVPPTSAEKKVAARELILKGIKDAKSANK